MIGSSETTSLNILLLSDEIHDQPNTVHDYVNAFEQYSRHRIYHFDPVWMRRSIFLNLDEFDALIIHYTITLDDDSYLSQIFRNQIARFSGVKLMILQDDYRRVAEYASAMRQLGVNILLTTISEIHSRAIWRSRLPGTVIKSVIPGYVPEKLKSLTTPPIEDRSLDVVYRGRTLPYWLGRSAQDKVIIGQGFLKYGAKYGLRCDIAWDEASRIYGEQWYDFIASAKATLGTESGSSIIDIDGSVETRTKAYLNVHPDASFDEVYEAVLQPYDGVVTVNTIPPKAFEAIALHTALVLFKGEYSGIIEPWKHYLPLEKDFTNIGEVVEKLRDIPFLEEMTERAYRDIVESGRYSYSTFVSEVDSLIEQQLVLNRATTSKLGYKLARVEQRLNYLRYNWARDVKRIVRRIASHRPLLSYDPKQ